MSVSQMLAHCNVTYEMAFTHHYQKAHAFKKVYSKPYGQKHDDR